MKDYLNWAILAPGNIANSMAAAMNGVSSDGKVKTYAVGSRDLQRAKRFAEKWHFSKAYGDYDEMLADSEIDAVYIANPHAFHYESVIKCLKAEKHVLCEKPAGCSLNQLETMIELAQKENLFFMEAMWTAFNPCIAKIQKIIKEGTIGDLIHIESHFCNRIPFDKNSRMYSPELAGGALLDLGIYNIYFAMMINNFVSVKNHSSNVRIFNEVDVWNSVNLTFENGVTTNFQSACDMPNSTDNHEAVIFGTKGYIRVFNFFFTQKAELHIYNSDGGNESSVQIIESPFRVNGYEYELIHATEQILNGKIESSVHTWEKSKALCKIMDELRKDWNMKYPWEK